MVTRNEESMFICHPRGFTAYRTTEVVTDAEMAQIGWVRVEFRTVMLRPPVCPVNGAEGGDEPYAARIPHRPDGTRLTLG